MAVILVEKRHPGVGFSCPVLVDQALAEPVCSASNRAQRGLVVVRLDPAPPVTSQDLGTGSTALSRAG